VIRKELEVLVVAADEADATFATRVLEEQGDRVSVAPSVPDAVGRLGRGDVDVALVSLSLPHGDGLALVHHLRALYPMVDVIVLTTPQDLEESSHAMALGVLQTVIRPLTGDALLVAVDRARERRMLLDQRARLDAEARSGRKRTATYARCAAFIAETDRDIVASRILEACSQELALRAGALYLPPHLGARAFTRSASVGDGDALPRALEPEALDELDPTQAVTVADGRIQIAFLGPMDLAAAAVLVPEKKLTEAQEDALTIIASLGTASLEAARKVDAIARSGIKDPETSAYTFAYFGDVAGREIDRAARHGRRFALVTITFDGAERLERTAPDVQRRIRRLLTESVLAAVRDSDVVARVEDDELFLLLPETALLGVLGARRRVEARFAAQQELQELLTAEHGGPPALHFGVAVYPFDGTDLGTLLRKSRDRSDQSRRGPWRRLELAGQPFFEALDRLMGTEDDVVVRPDGRVSLHGDLTAAHDQGAHHALLPASILPRLARSLVSDARRAGVAGVIYAAGDERMGEALRSAMDADAGRSPVRGWILTGERGDDLGRRALVVPREQLEGRVLLLALTELGGYVLSARRLDAPNLAEPTMLVYHASDLDMADGLVTALQRTYHLQPEVGQ